MTNKTVLVDFDGVLRHWSSATLSAAEAACGVATGTTLQTAFSRSLLAPAITGQITHLEWQDLVRTHLSKHHGSRAAMRLVQAWNAEKWEIDWALLHELRKAAPGYQLALATNATDRLHADLAKSGLNATFDVVVNSAEIGVVKPELAYFQHALALSNCVASAAIFIDDSPNNVSAARTSGITGIVHKCVAETLSLVERQCV